MAINMAASTAAPYKMAWTIEEAVSSRAHFREAGKLTVFNGVLPPGSAAIFEVGIVQALVSLEFATGVEADSILLPQYTVQPEIVAAIPATSKSAPVRRNSSKAIATTLSAEHQSTTRRAADRDATPSVQKHPSTTVLACSTSSHIAVGSRPRALDAIQRLGILIDGASLTSRLASVRPAQCPAGVPPGIKRRPWRRIGPFQDKSKFGQHKNCRVYVGDLGNRGNRQELEKAFGSYGPLKTVWVAQTPPGFAFVEFKDPKDAWDAVCALPGETLCGRRVRVQLSTKKRRTSCRHPSRLLTQAERTGAFADTFQSTSACSVDVGLFAFSHSRGRSDSVVRVLQLC
ncbi:hypothetical protein HPB50_008927 [Hyalomma asiaticum]|uniref:Uncharacterized protein n=1 Tax=Hyalomma asiaticum TaxID=266040 RepID=A0ACB7TH20_HYAAI|nr:hypothetical protein HPB50_008927 [Hyalomma asiaticum]